MQSILGSLGSVGLAVVLTALLILGTKGGGRAKPIAWGVAFPVGLLCGAAYKAAGPPFDLVGSGINDLTNSLIKAMPGLTLPAICLIIVIILAYKKMTIRAVGIWGIVLMYVGSNAGGAWSYAATQISLFMQANVG